MCIEEVPAGAVDASHHRLSTACPSLSGPGGHGASNLALELAPFVLLCDVVVEEVVAEDPRLANGPNGMTGACVS